MTNTLIVVLAIVALVVIVLAKTATVVPQQSAYVVETLGRYSRTLQAGFHILVPFVDRFADAADYGDASEVDAVLSTTEFRRESLITTLPVPWPLRSKRSLGPVEVLSGQLLLITPAPPSIT